MQKKNPNHKGRGLLFGGEGGVRTLDTLTRIHTFQACSFSHSDTSPFRYAVIVVQRGGTIGGGGLMVKQYLAVSIHLVIPHAYSVSHSQIR